MQIQSGLNIWLSTYGYSAEQGGRNWGTRHLSAEFNDAFVLKKLAPELNRLGIQYHYELSHSGTCYLYANEIKIRISDHEIDHTNYDLQILWPCDIDVIDIINYILHEEMRGEIEKNNQSA